MFENYQDVMTVNDVCSALSMGKNMLYKLLKMGTISYIRIGRKYLIPKVYLIDFVDRHR